MQQAASAANNPDTVETRSSRREHAAAASSPEQNAASPHPANTDNPHNAASRKLAIVGMIGEKRSWTRATSRPYPARRR
ncbi:hypothetical protein GCM10022224_091720 [Nonomuraea antimicrobica]|uniref:Uncharacterized protein n=1 Tax=Nonomuraea antimicrobica TaxID=561173 RepID=A0ABP7E0W1_9ACTN